MKSSAYLPVNFKTTPPHAPRFIDLMIEAATARPAIFSLAQTVPGYQLLFRELLRGMHSQKTRQTAEDPGLEAGASERRKMMTERRRQRYRGRERERKVGREKKLEECGMPEGAEGRARGRRGEKGPARCR